MNEENPLQAPVLGSKTSADFPLNDFLVRRGRMQLFMIVVFMFLVEFGPPLLIGMKPNTIRVVLLSGLLLAAWRGHGWAITLMALGFGLGLFFTIPAFIAAIASRSPKVFGFVLLIGVAYAGILVALIYSRSLNAYFKYQEQQRRPRTLVDAMQSNRRNIVTLTPGAVELARNIIADRHYESDTAIRVKLGNDVDMPFEVQYDLPSNDDLDWIGESSGIIVLVEKKIAHQLEGMIIDINDRQFICKTLSQ